MTDILFDPILRNCPLTASGDLEINTAPSTQNGTIILEARCVNLLKPAVGIGFNSQVLGSNASEATFQLNRCVEQIRSDNGLASWRPIPPPPNIQFDFELKVDYPN